MTQILLLIPKTTYRAGAFLAAVEKLGFSAIVGSNSEQALALFAPDKALKLDFDSPEEAVEIVMNSPFAGHLDAVLATEQDATLTAAHISSALGLNHNSPESTAAAKDKYVMRQLQKRAKQTTPEFFVFDCGNEFIAGGRSSYPCVLKPLRLSGSRGVIRADDAEQFVAAARRIRAILDLEPRFGLDVRQILVESYIPGDEVALEGLLTHGSLKVLTVYDKPDPLNGPYFEETIYLTPTRQPIQIRRRLARCVEETAHAIGMTTGPVHAELRINSAGIWIVEIAARSIGGLCSKTLRFKQGISLEELILRHSVGMSVAQIEREELAAGVMMIPIPKRGKLRSVLGVHAAKSINEIEDVRITAHLKMEVIPPPEGKSYLGFIFARAETTERVESALRRAHQKLHFEIA